MKGFGPFVVRRSTMSAKLQPQFGFISCGFPVGISFRLETEHELFSVCLSADRGYIGKWPKNALEKLRLGKVVDSILWMRHSSPNSWQCLSFFYNEPSIVQETNWKDGVKCTRFWSTNKSHQNTAERVMKSLLVRAVRRPRKGKSNSFPWKTRRSQKIHFITAKCSWEKRESKRIHNEWTANTKNGIGNGIRTIPWC